MSQTLIPSLSSSLTATELKFGRSVSLMQAAHLLGVSRRTVYNRIRDGQLETIRTHGSQRVLVASLFNLGVAPGSSPSMDHNSQHNAQL